MGRTIYNIQITGSYTYDGSTHESIHYLSQTVSGGKVHVQGIGGAPRCGWIAGLHTARPLAFYSVDQAVAYVDQLKAGQTSGICQKCAKDFDAFMRHHSYRVVSYETGFGGQIEGTWDSYTICWPEDAVKQADFEKAADDFLNPKPTLEDAAAELGIDLNRSKADDDAQREVEQWYCIGTHDSNDSTLSSWTILYGPSTWQRARLACDDHTTYTHHRIVPRDKLRGYRLHDHHSIPASGVDLKVYDVAAFDQITIDADAQQGYAWLAPQKNEAARVFQNGMRGLPHAADEKRWTVRVYRNANSMVAEDDALVVEVYDRTYPHTRFGQFTGARYYLSTLLAHARGTDLQLDCGIPAWTIFSPTMDQVLNWLTGFPGQPTVKDDPGAADQKRADDAKANLDRIEASLTNGDQELSDCFVSRFASGLTQREAEANAKLKREGGMAAFPALFDLATGKIVRTRVIDGQYGERWMAYRADGGRDFLPYHGRGTSKKIAAHLAKKGYQLGVVMAPAHAEIVGSGRGLSGLSSCSVATVRDDENAFDPTLAFDPDLAAKHLYDRDARREADAVRQAQIDADESTIVECADCREDMDTTTQTQLTPEGKPVCDRCATQRGADALDEARDQKYRLAWGGYGVRTNGQRASAIIANAVNDLDRRGKDQHPVWRDLNTAETARLKNETDQGQYLTFSGAGYQLFVLVLKDDSGRKFWKRDQHACVTRQTWKDGGPQQKVIEVDLTDDLLRLFGVTMEPLADAVTITGSDLAGDAATDADRAQLAANVAKIEAETEAKRAATCPACGSTDPANAKPWHYFSEDARAEIGGIVCRACGAVFEVGPDGAQQIDALPPQVAQDRDSAPLEDQLRFLLGDVRNAQLKDDLNEAGWAITNHLLCELGTLVDVADRKEAIRRQFEHDSTQIARTLAAYYIAALACVPPGQLKPQAYQNVTDDEVNRLLGDLAEDLRTRREA